MEILLDYARAMRVRNPGAAYRASPVRHALRLDVANDPMNVYALLMDPISLTLNRIHRMWRAAIWAARCTCGCARNKDS